MRWFLLALLAIGCGEVHFVDPNPPRLFRSHAQFTSAARDEPVVWIAILDLFIEDATACAWARQTTLATLRRAVTAAGGAQVELPAQDLAPECRARGTQAVDAEAVSAAFAAARTSFAGAHLRPLIVFVDNLDALLPSSMSAALASARALSSPPALLWSVSQPSVGSQLAADRIVEWTYAGDPELPARVAAAVSEFLPLRTTATATSGPVPLLDARQLETALEFKLCALPPGATARGAPLLGVTHMVDPANPPTITFDLPQLVATPRFLFSETQLSIPVEGCMGNCNRYYIGHPGDVPQRWDMMPDCALGHR